MDAESQQVLELKAEIARLKAENDLLRAANASFEGGMHWRNGLITELCDALESRIDWHVKPLRGDLLQRGREATRQT